MIIGRSGIRYTSLNLDNKQEILSHLKQYISEVNGHEIWLGAKNKSGHGMYRIGERMYLVSRLILHCYTDFNIHGSLQALHKNECHTPQCVRLDHLYVGDNGQNRGDYSELIQNSLEYRCGHPRTPENTYGKKTKYCKICSDRAKIVSRLKPKNIVQGAL